MRIVKFTAENVKKLKAVEIVPSGAVVEITGPNGSGKTSILDAIFYAVKGTAEIPSKVVREGEEKAQVKLDLGELIVTRRFTATGGTALVVEQANGARFPSPQKMLDELVGALSFDPLEFSRMEPREQLEALRKVVQTDVDISELDTSTAQLVQQRTQVNREVKQLEAQVAGLKVIDKVPLPVNVNLLVAELEAIGQRNQALTQRRAAAKANLSEAKEDRLQAEIRSERIEQLRKIILEHEKTIEKLDGEATAYEDKAIHQEALIEVDIPEDEDTREIKEKITQAQVDNKVCEEAERARQQHEQLAAELINKQTAAFTLTAAIDVNVQARAESIARSVMPVDGLSFGEGEVVYNGLPLGNASSAEQLRVGVAIAMSANPKLRVLRVKDGSLLDKSSLEALGNLVALNDFQLWIERVEEGGAMSVVMEDGAVKAALL